MPETNTTCSYCGSATYMSEGHCSQCELHCTHCDQWRNRWYNTECLNCGNYCEICGEYNLNESLSGRGLCSYVCPTCCDLFRSCSGCGEEHPDRSSNFHEADDAEGVFCSNCAMYCRTCTAYHTAPCTFVPTVRGYGHTEPSMWLGGPLPRDERGRMDGYYVGFELEVSASRQDASRIIQWSEQNLGVNIFDPKRDSSVSGFEIATQPMTPQYFEAVPWESFFEMLNDFHPISNGGDEPSGHGLHVHIGRVAFRSDVNLAAFAYLIGQGDHLERIGRRRQTNYCAKVAKPVSSAIVATKPSTNRQRTEVARKGGYSAGRDSINFGQRNTIEIRAFKSTRKAENLRSAVRMVYLSADYVRYLSRESLLPRAKALHWSSFAQWVAATHPDAFPAIAGIDEPIMTTAQVQTALDDLLSQPVNYTM